MRGTRILPRVPSGRPWLTMVMLATLAVAAVPVLIEAQEIPSAPTSGPDTVALRGVVVDSATGEPIPAVVVRLVELPRQDITHDDGTFHLSRLPEGSYTLIAEHLGYRRAQQQVSVPDDAGERLQITLAASALDLPALLVTATLGARSRKEAHSLSQVLGGRELQRELEVTLAETLEGRAGLASASMGPAPARPVIRGLSGDRILVLEDGERTGDVSSTSPDHAVALEPGSAERIEVVRGPAALFYGSNALGGVINVIREEIPSALPDHPSGTFMIQGQSVNRGGMAAANYKQALGPLGIRLEGSARSAGDTRTAAGPLPNSSITTYGGAVGAAWMGRFGHGGGAARAYRSRYGIPPDPVLGHPEGVTVELERDAFRGEGVVEEFRGLGQLVGTAGFTRYDHREIEAGGAVGTAFGQNTASTELVLRHTDLGPFAGGGFGVRADWESFISDNGPSVVRSTSVGGAVYGLEEIEIESLLLQFGARYDIQRITPEDVSDVRGIPARERIFQNVSSSASALWEFASGWRLGASLSRAFRAPSADELFTQGPHLAAYTYEVGNPDLDAETGLGADLFIRVDRPGISAETGVFWNAIDAYSYPVNTGDRYGSLFVYQFVNTNARFIGAEASGRWVVTSDLTLDGDLSYVRATNLALDEPLPLIPPLNGQLTLRWDREAYFVETAWRAAAAQDRVPERPELPTGVPPYCDQVSGGVDCRPVPGDFVPTPGYGILNLGAGYRWFPGHQVHSVTLGVDNVTDELYLNHLSRIKELSPEPGVGVTLSYRASF